MQKAIDRMDDHYWKLDEALRAIRGDNDPAVDAHNFQPVLYLQEKRKFTFSVTGDKGLFAGFKVIHLPGKGGHSKAVSEAGQTDNRKQRFKDHLGEFTIDGHGEFGRFELLQGMGLVLPGGKEHVKVTYTHGDFSGWFYIRICLHQDKGMLSSMLEHGARGQDCVYKQYMFDAVYQQRLEPLSGFDIKDGEKNPSVFTDGNLVFYQGITEHKYHSNIMSHYGKPELNRKLREVGRLFAEKFPGAQVWINDMSLPWGGSFRTNQQLGDDWGHNSHKAGDNADISFNKLKSKQQRIELDRIIQQVFTNEYYKFHGGPGNRHWHVSTVKLSATSLPMIEGFLNYFASTDRKDEKRDETVKELIDYNFIWEFYRELRKTSDEEKNNHLYWMFYRSLGRVSQRNEKYYSILKEVTKKMFPTMTRSN